MYKKTFEIVLIYRMFHDIQICLIQEKISVINSLISGFLHQGVEHLLLNMTIMFIGMLCPINREFSRESIFTLDSSNLKEFFIFMECRII